MRTCSTLTVATIGQPRPDLVDPARRSAPSANSGDRYACAAYHKNAAHRHESSRLSSRAQLDGAMKPEVRRIFDANFNVCDLRKVTWQMRREGCGIARCTVVRLIRDLGLAGVTKGRIGHDNHLRQGSAVPTRSGKPAGRRTGAEHVVGARLNLRRNVGRFRIRGPS